MTDDKTGRGEPLALFFVFASHITPYQALILFIAVRIDFSLKGLTQVRRFFECLLAFLRHRKLTRGCGLFALCGIMSGKMDLTYLKRAMFGEC